MNLALDLTLVGVVMLAAFFDLKERRIPNWLVLFGFLGGVLLNATQGFDKFSFSLIGFVLAILLFLVPFAFGWIGAGDVKLFGAVGALLGVGLLPRVFLYSAIAAGILALISLALGHAKIGSVANLWRDVKLAWLTSGATLPEPVVHRAVTGAKGVPWGVAIGIGTVMAYYADPVGRWAGV